ncbi:MAG TPA: flagellar biosynthesis protein FliQ [Burkholderiaceae bacterium]|nr:flagellar biosynthesis protein FliQ [Burkholderiaceae bacterium]
MNSMTVMTLTYQAMLVALKMAAPLLLTVLIVGLVISIFQAATQVNEMTLAFVPKLLAAGTALVLLGPWLITTMVDYIQTLIGMIPQLVQ